MLDGLQNRIAREALEEAWRTKAYASTPPAKVTRQMRRSMDRAASKVEIGLRKKSARKDKGGSAVVR